MTKNKSINHEEQERVSIKPTRDARYGLHLIPSKESGIRNSVPADESLRELLEAFKRPNKDERQAGDDKGLPPAA